MSISTLYDCEKCSTPVTLSPALSDRRGHDGKPMTKAEALSIFRDRRSGLCEKCYALKQQQEMSELLRKHRERDAASVVRIEGGRPPPFPSITAVLEEVEKDTGISVREMSGLMLDQPDNEDFHKVVNAVGERIGAERLMSLLRFIRHGPHILSSEGKSVLDQLMIATGLKQDNLLKVLQSKPDTEFFARVHKLFNELLPGVPVGAGVSIEVLQKKL